MLAISEGSFSNWTQAGEFSASVYLPKVLAALHLRRIIKSSIQKIGRQWESTVEIRRLHQLWSAVPTPDRISFVVAQNKGVGALYDFASEDEVGFPLLNF